MVNVVVCACMCVFIIILNTLFSAYVQYNHYLSPLVYLLQDQRPQWLSPSLEAITDEQIEPFFAPLGDHELVLDGDEESKQ